MTFSLTIKCDNAAFGEDPEGEVIRILQKLVADVQRGNGEGRVFDINGNSVGEWRLA